MKIRHDFVTNSSSSSFIIKNKTDKNLTLVDLAIEMTENIQYQHDDKWHRLNSLPTESLISCADSYKQHYAFNIPANDKISFDCGDHSDDGELENIIHQIEDFLTESFEVSFEESYH